MKNPLARARGPRSAGAETPRRHAAVPDLEHAAGQRASGARPARARLTGALADRPVRSRVLLAVSVPMTLAAVLGGTQVVSQWQEASEVRATAAAATVLVPLAEMVATGSEATATHREAVSGGADAEAAQARREVSRGTPAQDVAAATRDFTTVVEGAGFTVEQSTLAGSLVRVVEQLGDPATHTTRSASVSALRQLQRASSQLVAAIQAEQVTPEPLIGVVARTVEGQVSLAVQQVLAQGNRDGRDVQTEELAEIGAEAAVIESLGQSLGVYDPTVERLRQHNASHRDAATFGLRPAGHDEAAALYADLTADLVAAVDARLDAAATRADRAAWILALVLGLAVVLALAVAVVVARSVVRPLQRLTASAQEIARRQLPGAVATLRAGGTASPSSVGITSADEVGTLASAVDDLHASALALAGDEVRTRAQMDAMLITLSRRSTALVNQQLTLIEKLEGSERDPAVLEQYFRLDHLAVRMRRTAESLLVLADEQPQRRATALTLSDAAQAACAGVADYRRVEVVGLEDEVMVTAAVAGDLVHLLTELVDNAVNFSPPGTTVRVAVAVTGDGAHVRISDRGLGIGVEQREALNEVLRSPGGVTESTPRRMGVFVVARLAQRHAMGVRLVANTLGGTTAEVHLPPLLVRPVTPDERRGAAVQGTSGPGLASVPVPARSPVSAARASRHAPADLVPLADPTPLAGAGSSGDSGPATGPGAVVAHEAPRELTEAGLPVRRTRGHRAPTDGASSTSDGQRPAAVHVPGRRVRGEVADTAFAAFGAPVSTGGAAPDAALAGVPAPTTASAVVPDPAALRALLSAHQSGVARAASAADREDQT